MEQWRPGGVFDSIAARAIAERHVHLALDPGKPGALAAWEARQLTTATLWWVGEDMVDLLMAAAASIPDDVRLQDLPQPSHSGVVVFAKPWRGVDADRPDEQVEVDALVWGTDKLTGWWGPERQYATEIATSVSSYRKLVFEDGLPGPLLEMASALGCMNHGVRHLLPDLREATSGKGGTFVMDDTASPVPSPLSNTIVVNDGEKWQAIDHTEPHPGSTDSDVIRAHLSRPGVKGYRMTGCSWAPLGRSDWPLKDPLGTRPFPMDDRTWESYREDRRILTALWTLLRTRAVAATTEHTPERAARRRTERAGLPRALANVRTITLRQPERAAHEPEEGQEGRRTYSHRWMVQPHFCWQPCGPGRKDRKLIIRGPYLKGPADAPLHTPAVVRAWVR